MIDFACKKFEIEEVVKCSLALTKSDYRLLKHFIKNSSDRFSTEELASVLSLDKSTIQRGVKKLHEKGLLFRTQKNQEVGGYLFFYEIKDKEKIRSQIIDIINGWTDRFKEEIKKW